MNVLFHNFQFTEVRYFRRAYSTKPLTLKFQMSFRPLLCETHNKQLSTNICGIYYGGSDTNHNSGFCN